MRILLAVTVTLLAAFAAVAQEVPTSKDVTTLQSCLKARGKSQDACIEAVYRPCIGPREDAKPPSAIQDCFGREKAAWDKLLNDAFRAMRDGLEEDQKAKLRDMQRAWIDSRDKTCAFYYDYFQGTMANPMIANCENRETARRAIFLMGFADDMKGR
jgi:uncharacterized protein YecT (DUF1311 family)